MFEANSYSLRFVVSAGRGAQIWVTLLFLLSFSTAQDPAPASRTHENSSGTEDFEPKVGLSVQRELRTGNAQSYRLPLDASQFIHIVIEQEGVDVIGTIFSPEGKQLAEYDSCEVGREPVSLVAELAGNYLLQLRTVGRDVAPGRYRIRIDALRPGGPADKQWVSAEKFTTEGKQLFREGAVESARKALKKYEEALPLWQMLGDNHSQAETLINLGRISSSVGDKRKGRDYTERALCLLEALGNVRRQAVALGNLGALTAASLSVTRAGSPSGAEQTVGQTVAPTSDTPELKPGVVIQRTLESDEAHWYRVLLEPGQSCRFVVDQRDADLTIALFGPDGAAMGEVDCRWRGAERASVTAVLPGAYRIRILSNERTKSAAHYSATIQAVDATRPAVADRTLAERAMTEGKRQGERSTAESLQAAEKAYERALTLWEKLADQAEQADTLQSLANVLNGRGEPRKALEFYAKAVTLFRAVKDSAGEAETLNNAGWVLTQLGEYSRALENYDQALTAARAAGDRDTETATLSNIGLIHSRQARYQIALDYYNRALEIARALGNPSREGTTLINIARVYEMQDDLRNVMDYYKLALPLLRAAGNRHGEAILIHNLAAIYHRRGEIQKAFRHFEEALQIEQATADRSTQSLTLNSIGMLYQELNELDEALAYYSKALTIAQTLENRSAEATLLHNIGVVHYFQGQKEKALENFERAYALRRALGDPVGEANELNSMANVAHDHGQKEKALEQLEQALTISRAASSRWGQFQILQNLGRVHGSFGDEHKALQYLDRALAGWRDLGIGSRQASALYEMARIYRNRGDFADARTHLTQALDLIESVRTRIDSQELRASYLGSKRTYYELLIDILVRLDKKDPARGMAAEAIQTAERARARSFLESLTFSEVDLRRGVDPTLLERERELKHAINSKAHRQARILRANASQEEVTKVSEELGAALSAYRKLEAEIRASNPAYAALTQPQLLDLPKIQALLDPNTVLLEYALGDEWSYVWAVTPTSIVSAELPKRAIVEVSAREVYEAARARPASAGSGDSTDALDKAAALSELVLGPVAAQLTAKRLLIVSDGALQYVPFGALPSPSGTGAQGVRRRLVQDHEIVHLPSASVLAVLRRQTATRAAAPRGLAVLADPVFHAEDVRVKQAKARPRAVQLQSVAMGGEAADAERDLERATRDIGLATGPTPLPRLAFSRREADDILQLVPTRQALRAVDFAANRQLAASPSLKHYRMVHFATHGLLNTVHPELSGLVLSLVDERGSAQDGFLRLHDIYNLELGADLVVLSACQTGLGKEVLGEGLIGLTRGFMYAGAPRVVVSLWTVDDEATAALMHRFYTGMLREGLTPAAALRQAQLYLSKQSHWQAPYYWAGFILQGEYR